MGDPVGPPDVRAELVWRFREDCDRYAARPVFYQVGVDDLPNYLDAGLTLSKIGEEARVDLADFSLAGSRAAVDGDDVGLKIYLYSRAQSVMGGTSQIQKNIIATRILGLPAA
jgi:hypothetical protein